MIPRVIRHLIDAVRKGALVAPFVSPPPPRPPVSGTPPAPATEGASPRWPAASASPPSTRPPARARSTTAPAAGSSCTGRRRRRRRRRRRPGRPPRRREWTRCPRPASAGATSAPTLTTGATRSPVRYRCANTIQMRIAQRVRLRKLLPIRNISQDTVALTVGPAPRRTGPT